MKRIDPIRKVVLILRMTGASGRDLMSGVFRYAQAGRHWNIRLIQMPDRVTSDVVRQFEADKVDGIIASELGVAGAPVLLARSKIPLVVVGPREKAIERRTRNIAFVRNDEREIGRHAARYLSGLGRFRSFGYVPARGSYFWSDEREIGYRDHLAEHGIRYRRFEPVAPSGSAEDRSALECWLRELPKPTALMCAWDFRATQVMDALNNIKIQVPEEASVLGVDNDELLCDYTNPPLSSLLPDHVHAGYRAAEELQRLMSGRGKTDEPKTVFCHFKGVIERESTKAVSPVAHLIEKGLTFIDRYATSGIGVKDVVDHLGCSRRLADLRFSQFQHGSILQAINERKLKEVCRLLAGSRQSILAITQACGFRSPNHLKKLFKSRYGVSMRDWRLTHR